MTKYALFPLALLLAGCGEHLPVGETRHETRSIELDRSELTRVDLRMGAGELNVAGGAAKLMDAEFTYNIDRWKPVVEHHSTGVRSDIEVSQPSNAGFPLGDVDYRWDVRLNNGVLMDVLAKLGAGEAKLNLGTLSLRNVEVDMGAGSVRMDLRGSPKRSYDVHISGGVGEAVVYVPRHVGISATASGGIGEINVDGLEKRNGRWINSGHENDPVQIRLDIKGGVGEIRIIAE